MSADERPDERPDGHADAAALRLRAEALLQARTLVAPRSATDGERLLHELQVHQIELELQNEEPVARRDELEAGLARYTDLYDFAPVAYASLSADGTLTQTNLAGARLLGSPRAQLEGKRVAFFVINADRRTFRNWLDQVFAGTEPRPCQLRLHPVDPAEGTQRTVRFDGKLSAKGSQCRTVLTNLTQQLAAEAVHRSLELQVRESQKMVAIGTLAGGIAHDFNNILGAILGNVELAQQDVGQGHVALLPLAQIQKAGLRARSLVEQILAFSHQQTQAPVRLALQAPIEEALALLRATLPAGVQLQASLSTQPLIALADATQLLQVVMNLCTNAWQAVPGTGGRVELELDAMLPGVAIEPPPPAGLAPGSYARLRVRDNGCGMDAATQARVFEPFFTTKPVGLGTGLGLAVVHGIVTSMGGALSVHSAPRQGSLFEVWLPLLEAPADAVAAPAELGPPPPPPPAVVGPVGHVVYVDDDEVMQVMMEHWLRRQGYRVSAFADPLVALQALRAAPMDFDVVVTDFNMPGMSGLALAEVLAVLRPDLPVVISSGYVSEDLRESARRCGVREVIHKADGTAQLGALLQRLLGDTPS